MRSVSRCLVVLLSGLLPIVVLAAQPALAHKSPPDAFRVVIQMTAEKPEQWEGLLSNIQNMQAALGNTLQVVEVVVYGKGLGMVMASNIALAGRMETMSKRNVRFVACENTMRREGVTKKYLLPFVGVIDSGVAQIVRRQQDGWQLVHVGQ